MLKFIKHIIFFFLVIAILDFSFGKMCTYLNSHAKGGDTKSHYYIAKECKEDVLIFGSSRAVHHYIPYLIEKKLNMTVYNCGTEGNGILLMYSYLRMITQRYTPKVIVYDVCSEFDIYANDNTKYLGWQKRFYDEPGIKDVFNDVNKVEQYKMYSNFYRYNTDFIQMLGDNFKPQKQVLYGGYKPFFEVMNTTAHDILESNKILCWDPLKKKYWNNFIELCHERNIQLVLSFSPFYGKTDINEFNPLIKLCAKNNVLIINNYTEQNFAKHPEWFSDPSHLNNTGAVYFSRQFANELYKIIR